MPREKVILFDTTLRDGQQTTGVNFSVSDKMNISQHLDDLGIDYIEGGWPGANPTDTKFFENKNNFSNAKFTAFGMTKRSGRSADNDPQLRSLIDAHSDSVCLVAKTWDFHVDLALGISLEENIEAIKDSVLSVEALLKGTAYEKESGPIGENQLTDRPVEDLTLLESNELS